MTLPIILHESEIWTHTQKDKKLLTTFQRNFF